MGNNPFEDWISQDIEISEVKLAYLLVDDKISKDQYERLKEMHLSPDKENKEIVNQIIEIKDDN
jgi:hypothetical protein